MKKKKFSDEEIRKLAKDFVKLLFPPGMYETKCAVCKAENCKQNETCINCNSQLPNPN